MKWVSSKFIIHVYVNDAIPIARRTFSFGIESARNGTPIYLADLNIQVPLRYQTGTLDIYAGVDNHKPYNKNKVGQELLHVHLEGKLAIIQKTSFPEKSFTEVDFADKVIVGTVRPWEIFSFLPCLFVAMTVVSKKLFNCFQWSTLAHALSVLTSHWSRLYS